MNVRQIPSLVGYGVDENGRVYSMRSRRGGEHLTGVWKELSVAESSNGYSVVALVSSDGIRRTRYVHRLVVETFVGPIPKGCEVSHLNGHRRDNRVGNLAIETHVENERRKIEHGTHQAGRGNGRARLSDEAVARIRAEYGEGFPYGARKRLAEQYGVTGMSIYYGRSRPHMGEERQVRPAEAGMKQPMELCPGRTNGDYRIARECADCKRRTTKPKPLSTWITPPTEQPCKRRIDR